MTQQKQNSVGRNKTIIKQNDSSSAETPTPPTYLIDTNCRVCWDFAFRRSFPLSLCLQFSIWGLLTQNNQVDVDFQRHEAISVARKNIYVSLKTRWRIITLTQYRQLPFHNTILRRKTNKTWNWNKKWFGSTKYQVQNSSTCQASLAVRATVSWYLI